MSRIARIKPAESIYHIMCRSISEFNLFKENDDKRYYLGLLKKYCCKFHCSIIAYCLMDNHLHLHFDPQGFDISKFMLCVNLSYVLYYNRKYKRHGHLFQGRFESRIISSESYNLAVSAYIHNNPKDIDGYLGREHEYPFSSMGIYLGTHKDLLNLVNTGFILSLFDAKDKLIAIKHYAQFVFKQRNEATDKSIAKCLKRFVSNEYRCERRIVFRNFKPSEIISTVAIKLGIPDKEFIRLKSTRAAANFRAYCVFIMRSLCGFSIREICQSIGNISLSGVSRLCSKGFELYLERQEYKDVFDAIIQTN